MIKTKKYSKYTFYNVFHLVSIKNLLFIALPWLLLILFWSQIRLINEQYYALIPSPGSVIKNGLTLLKDGTLLTNWAYSTFRVITGVTFGILVAVPIGLALGWNKKLHKILTPILNFFRALPPIALIPLVIVYLGIGEPAKILVLVYAAFSSSVIIIFEGVWQIPPIYFNVARNLGANEREIFTRVMFPLIIPHILTSVRVSLGSCWMTLVAAELISAQQGIGSMIQIAASYFQLETIYLGLLIIGFTAMAMDLLLIHASRRIVSWEGK